MPLAPQNQTPPLLVTQIEARRQLGLSRTKYHRLKNLGTFDIVRLGPRDMVTFESLRRIATPK